MCARLDTYLQSNSILCTNQFGFRENPNTSDAIIEFLDFIYLSLDSKQSSIAEYLDFRKAVNHDILMYWLLNNGIRGVMPSWFKSVLSIRKQYVSIKNCSPSVQTLH